MFGDDDNVDLGEGGGSIGLEVVTKLRKTERLLAGGKDF
jgi:hypothetical protein